MELELSGIYKMELTPCMIWTVWFDNIIIILAVYILLTFYYYYISWYSIFLYVIPYTCSNVQQVHVIDTRCFAVDHIKETTELI